MELKILGSGSAGNCYILDNGKEALVIEAGVSFNEVKKAVGFDISRIVGCLVSHEHGDHAKYYKSLGDLGRIHVITSLGTMETLRTKDGVCPYVLGCDCMKKFDVGNFICMAFPIKHDAVEPMGFLIHHPETGTILYATDTYYLEYTFEGLNNILIECNYRLDILEANVAADSVPKTQRDRTLQSHMSFDTCKETLLANDLRAVNNIVLIHLSDGNSNAAEFRQSIAEATGKTVHVADRGMVLNFNKTPF